MWREGRLVRIERSGRLCPLHRHARATIIGVSLLALGATVAAPALYPNDYTAYTSVLPVSPIAATLILAAAQPFIGAQR